MTHPPLPLVLRRLAHNGEINTLLGNVNWQRALDAVRARRDPLCSLDRSDSVRSAPLPLPSAPDGARLGANAPTRSHSAPIPHPTFVGHEPVLASALRAHAAPAFLPLHLPLLSPPHARALPPAPVGPPPHTQANLDAVFEHLRRNTDIEPAMAIGMLVPEAYREQPDYDEHPEVTRRVEGRAVAVF